MWLTNFSAKSDEVEHVVTGKPGSGCDVISARKFAIRNGKIWRLLPGCAQHDFLQQLHGLLTDGVCMLKIINLTY